MADPEVGQVIRYGYLWHREEELGREESRKARPCAIVVALRGRLPEKEGFHVAVVAITHSPPRDPADAIELPRAVKHRLGLDDEASWAVVSEVNQFRWPGPDLLPLRAQHMRKDMIYGSLPKKLMDRILEQLGTHIRAGRLKVVRRTE